MCYRDNEKQKLSSSEALEYPTNTFQMCNLDGGMLTRLEGRVSRTF